MPHATVDVDLTAKNVAAVASPDALAALLYRLGYPTGGRKVLAPAGLGLSEDSSIKKLELMSEDAEGFLRVFFVQVSSITAKTRNDLVRVLGKSNQDHLLILTKDFSTLELVLIVKVKHQKNMADDGGYKAVAKSLNVQRSNVDRTTLRILRRLTWTASDGLAQYDKLRSVFEAASYSGEYFQNRALFADHFLTTRLKDDLHWAESPNTAYGQIRSLFEKAKPSVVGQNETAARGHFFEPLFGTLGFQFLANAIKPDADPVADYELTDAGGKPVVAALVYQWDRWLDGPDDRDSLTPTENPGATVVSLLDQQKWGWVIVTNGRQWRLYSRHAHSRSTNFYEVELEEALPSDGTDPNEAFRYFWLFFRRQAFEPAAVGRPVWLDAIVEGSRDYAREVERALKKRVFERVVPFLAKGFLSDRSKRLGMKVRPSEEELETIRQGTLTFLYRILFLLYAESRDLLPVRESPYFQLSLKRVKEEIADVAGLADSAADERLSARYKADEESLYRRLEKLCAAMDKGDAAINVPTYNGGLFRTRVAKKDEADDREAQIATFLREHAVPDLHLAVAIDHLARVPDERQGFGLAFVDYKSLGVRQLGSIYEGLLEYRLFVAEEDLVAVKEKASLVYKPLNEVAERQRQRADALIVKRGDVYLATDKAERKATGSYYTPENIVEYIVAQTVGPVLQRKLDALVPEFRKAEQTYQRLIANEQAAQKKLEREGRKVVLRPEVVRARAANEAYDAHRDLVEKLFDIKVLDPSMGSGHFLVDAVDFITDRLLVWLNQFRPFNPVVAMLQRTRRNLLESLEEQKVNIDPDRLTDVHLLKRHVLKRCIYGVDLNPLATELAKVSLWLDAFTLGAPLSFLDHHLRVGNSLIGSSFSELEKLTSDRLFSIDYQPMLIAIRNVLNVSRLADTTASEVHKSATDYADARDHLDGYRLVLDLIVAQYFGDPKAALLITDASDLRLDSRKEFLKALGARDRAIVQKADAWSGQRRFFHWELEFPEIFFHYREGSKQQVERKADTVAGFDCVIGNPPYDELSEHASGRELPEKVFFASSTLYQPALGGRLNLFRLFIIRSLTVLASSGTHGFIVPLSILGDSFTAGTRRYMLDRAMVREVIAFPQKDDPHARVFFEAKLSTCVILSENLPRPEVPIKIRSYPRNVFTDKPRACELLISELLELDADQLPLPAIDISDLQCWRIIRSAPRLTAFGSVAKCWLGELMTNASNEHLTSSKRIGPRLLRGANVNYYVLLEEPKQGDPLYLDEETYLDEYKDDPRSQHHLMERIGFQESCPMDNWRRLIACRIPAGHYCVHKIRYFAKPSAYDLYAVLAFFNSAMADWRFSLTSTNNSLSEYAVNAIPLPRFERINNPVLPPMELAGWNDLLNPVNPVSDWESKAVEHINDTPKDAISWPNSVHDAIASAGRSLVALAERRHASTQAFSKWLFETLVVDVDRFTGVTLLRGGQSTIDSLKESEFLALLERNRTAIKEPLERHLAEICTKFQSVALIQRSDKARFEALLSAVDRIIWRLVGITPSAAPSVGATNASLSN